jgi:hypothetical protein
MIMNDLWDWSVLCTVCFRSFWVFNSEALIKSYVNVNGRDVFFLHRKSQRVYFCLSEMQSIEVKVLGLFLQTVSSVVTIPNDHTEHWFAQCLGELTTKLYAVFFLLFQFQSGQISVQGSHGLVKSGIWTKLWKCLEMSGILTQWPVKREMGTLC